MDHRTDGVAHAVRLAVSADARALAEVHTATWRVAYQGLMPEDFLRDLSVDERTERWRGRLPATAVDTPAPRGKLDQRTWVATADHTVVGFCSLGPPRDDDALPGEAELYALYVHPSRWREGVGGSLMAAAEAAAVRAGAATLSLWVLRDNPRARSFYEARGFVVDGGTRDEAVGGVPLAHVRYRKAP